ncbi:MAG TPA: hypothetical protein VLA00_06795 [Xanthobacteraceae bacterium]|nr:hypothetical protein [Xanthobacteraceae bacterium]
MRVVPAFIAAFVALLTLSIVAAPARAQSQSASPAAAPTRPGHVYLLRGLANVFSFGMDTLAQKLTAQGVKATVHSYTDWQTLARMATAEAASVGGRYPIIIVGHSLGADAALYMANRLADGGTPVVLVATFDPVTPRINASPKIGRVLNFYQAGGSGKAVGGANVSNVDLTGTNSLTHFNIDKAADLHAQVIAQVMKAAGPTVARKPRRKPAAPIAAPEAAAPAEAAAPGATPASGGQAAASSVATPAAAAAPAAESAKPASAM